MPLSDTLGAERLALDEVERSAHAVHLYHLVAQSADAYSNRHRHLFQEFNYVVLRRVPSGAAGRVDWLVLRDGEGFVVRVVDAERSLMRQYGA